ncbi:MAG TPA: 3-deoxy-manno-octulosonate cytidylyltransferase [Lacipirellulaceae bacterium]|nr:3-deoxy-manno-octulosonate cytidylyltransferase [Lacipirellulaceae bacterium]HMP06566.1 3-deoxy-manno-octulosonate cytidylyltransferase [Lacipirellulaceae bacterium]
MNAALHNARRVLAIPARRRSTRLPDKMLLCETGKTVLQHTYEAACRARAPEAVFIATDDDEIAAVARSFGADVVMTSPDAPSGTDRIAEAVHSLPRAGVIVNLQGDEPDADPEAVDALFDLLDRQPWASMATVATPLRDLEKLHDPACVKVVCDSKGRALYFSRSVTPFPRDGVAEWLSAEPPAFLQHIGMYAYRRPLLMQMTRWPVGRLEQIEKLEQLRVLENGHAILVAVVNHATRGIDTPEDYAAFVARRRAA